MKAQNKTETRLSNLPNCAGEFIRLVIKKMRYRRKVRADVMAELAAHFEDELEDCTNGEEREQKAQRLIEDFGDAKLLAVLLRRAKKRCRPLWRTVVARTFQTIGILILCLIVYVAWFLTGKPVISVDYLAILNQINRPQIIDKDNAWPHYERAFGLFIEPNETLQEIPVFENYRDAAYRKFGKLNESEKKEIEKWVEQNQAAWQEFTLGSSQKYCYRENKYNDKDKEKWLWDILARHLDSFRSLVKAGIWRSRVHIKQGKLQQAVEDCTVLIRVGRHLQNNKVSMTEQISGLSISNLGHKEVLTIISDDDGLSSAQLKQIQEQLSAIYLDGYPLANIGSEREMFLDIVQHLFTDGGPGGGHLVPSRLLDFNYTKWGGHMGPQRYAIVPFTALAIIHAHRNETITNANEIYDRLNKTIELSPYQRYTNKVATSNEILAELSKYRYFLLHMFTPSADRFSDIAFYGKTLHEATLTVLALLRYEKENGEYPESLNDLVAADYLKELPVDPFSDEPLIYKRTKDSFILYSVSFNLTDDGGELGKNDKGRPTDSKGDAVFWPVAK